MVSLGLWVERITGAHGFASWRLQMGEDANEDDKEKRIASQMKSAHVHEKDVAR